MKKLIICAGLPGSGKSYLAKKLVKKLKKVLYFDSDAFAKNYLKGRDVSDPGVRLDCHKAKLVHILKEFKKYNYILLDTCFDMPKSRSMIYKFCRENCVKLIILEVVCSFATAKARILKGGDEHRMPGTIKSRWQGYLKMRRNWKRISKVSMRVDSNKDIESQLGVMF